MGVFAFEARLEAPEARRVAETVAAVAEIAVEADSAAPMVAAVVFAVVVPGAAVEMAAPAYAVAVVAAEDVVVVD
ncbi:MAG: hypothetical protein FWE04_05320 [Oscillospiraceae bacterium]|nr:hypothetical protein [Oscillospiraceae bacterium]